MKLLLVDSDAENIKNFRTHIKNNFPAIRIVGHFSDISQDILPTIRSLNPDIILSDIRFFGGMHFIRLRQLYEELPLLRFIMYGTLAEADYMKRGREFGVLDFCYRPVRPSDLNRCLNLSAEYCKKAEEDRRQKKVLSDSYHARLFAYEEIFLRTLLDGHINRENEVRDGFGYFQIPFDTNFFVFIVRIDHFKRVALTMTEPEKHMRIIGILNAINHTLRDYKCRAFIRRFHEIPIIINLDASVEEKVLLGDKIKHAILDATKTRCTIGVGRTYGSPLEIPISAREADAAFGYRYRMGYHTVIPIEFVEPTNTITFRYPQARERRLVYSAVVGDYEYSKAILRELFNSLAEAGPLPDNLVAKTVMAIVFRISRYLSELNVPFAGEVTKYFPTAQMIKLVTIEDGYEFLDSSLKAFCGFIASRHARDSSALHRAAKEYIQKNYFENFSIAKIAVKLGATPENLNKVFMEHERVMLYDFCMYTRVLAAQKQLAQTATEEDIIAVQVGFDDVKYFRSIFRKYLGETPAEFRAKALL